jgi:hypothetical protein
MADRSFAQLNEQLIATAAHRFYYLTGGMSGLSEAAGGPDVQKVIWTDEA